MFGGFVCGCCCLERFLVLGGFCYCIGVGWLCLFFWLVVLYVDVLLGVLEFIFGWGCVCFCVVLFCFVLWWCVGVDRIGGSRFGRVDNWLVLF